MGRMRPGPGQGCEAGDGVAEEQGGWEGGAGGVHPDTGGRQLWAGHLSVIALSHVPGGRSGAEEGPGLHCQRSPEGQGPRMSGCWLEGAGTPGGGAGPWVGGR